MADGGRGIQQATERFVAAAADVAPDRWAVAPSGGGWSAAEVTEHVAIASGNVLRALERGLQPLDGPTAVDDELIPYLFYRGDEPPDVARPTGSWTDQEQALADLRASADGLTAWAEQADQDLRAVGFAHPVFGLLDGEQWLRFAAAHTLRHHAQLLALA